MPGPALRVNHCPGELALRWVKLVWFGAGGYVSSLDKGQKRGQDVCWEGNTEGRVPVDKVKEVSGTGY